MRAATHLLGGQCAYLLAALIGGYSPSWPQSLAAAGAALLPDLDHHAALLPHWPWLARYGHRQLSHSLMLGLLWTAAVWPLPSGWTLALSAGFHSHAVLDMLTPAGVAWLWPLPWRCVWIPSCAQRIRVGSLAERVLLWLFAGLSWPLVALAEPGVGVLGQLRNGFATLSTARQHYQQQQSDAQWWLHLEAQDRHLRQRISGRFSVVAAYADGLLLDGPDGLYSVCYAETCDAYPLHSVLERGAAQHTSVFTWQLPLVQVHALREQLTPLQDYGTVYLLGQFEAPPLPSQPPGLQLDGTRYRLQYLPLHQLQRWPSASLLRRVELQIQVRHPPTHIPPAPEPPTLPADPIPPLLRPYLPP